MNTCYPNSFTWCADVAAASVKLLARTVTLLLLPAGQNVDVHWSRRQVLNHDSLIRTIMFVGPIDATGVPVSPVDELAKHGHSKWVDGCTDNDLTVGSRKRGSLNFLSGRANGGTNFRERK